MHGGHNAAGESTLDSKIVLGGLARRGGLRRLGGFLAAWGAVLGGWFWTAGNSVQIAMMVAEGISSRLAATAVLSVASSVVAGLFGKTRWGIPATCAMGAGAVTLLLLPQLLSLVPSALSGWALFCSSMLLGGMSGPLARHASRTSRPSLRLLFAHARLVAWGTSLCSRLPVILGALLASPQNGYVAVMFLLFALGDACAMLSRPHPTP